MVNDDNKEKPDFDWSRIDWQCDKGICEYDDRIAGKCECYNAERKDK